MSTSDTERRTAAFKNLRGSVNNLLGYMEVTNTLPDETLSRVLYDMNRTVADLVPDVDYDETLYISNAYIKLRIVKAWNRESRKLRDTLIAKCKTLELEVEWLDGDDLLDAESAVNELFEKEGGAYSKYFPRVFIVYAINGLFHLFQKYYNKRMEQFEKLEFSVPKEAHVFSTFMDKWIPSEYFMYDLLGIMSLMQMHSRIGLGGDFNIVASDKIAKSIIPWLVDYYYMGFRGLDYAFEDVRTELLGTKPAIETKSKGA